ncbi:MAG: hypothetical protein Q9163_003373 [Psora crenata]
MKVPAILKDSDAYPPTDWSHINDKIETAGNFSKHDLWLEMTDSYTQSMTARRQERINNMLPNTMPKEKYEQMPAKIQDRQDATRNVTDEAAHVCGYLISNVEDYDSMMMYTKVHQLDTVLEGKETTTTSDSHLTPTERSIEQHVLSKIAHYGHLMMSDGVQPSFRKRLGEIINRYEDFKYCRNERNAPTFGSLMLLDKEVDQAKEQCQQCMKGYTQQLKGFLADCLVDEYVLPNPNRNNAKSSIWTQYGTYLYWQGRKGARRDAELDNLAEQCGCSPHELHELFGEELNMAIRTSKLEEPYVKKRITEYYQDLYMGRWQRYVRQHRWEALAKKLHEDRQRLDAFIDGEVTMPNQGEQMTLKCQVLINMRLTRSKYFKRLDGPADFELSKTALAMVKKKVEAEAKRIKAEEDAEEAKKKGVEATAVTERTSEPGLRSRLLPQIFRRRHTSSP